MGPDPLRNILLNMRFRGEFDRIFNHFLTKIKGDPNPEGPKNTVPTGSGTLVLSFELITVPEF
jgi:hypothetical protein